MDDYSKRLDDIAEKWLDDGFKVSPSMMPEYVYHYTDAAGLKGMLDQGLLWATDYRFLNDKEEVSHLRRAVNDVLGEEHRNNSNSTVKRICAEAGLYGNIETPYEIFIFSASAQEDDLSQWRGYAKEGCGFTIGFDAPKLMALCDTLAISCGFGRVEYNHDEQIKSVRRALAEIGAVVERELKKKGANADEIFDKAAQTLDLIVEVRAAISKHNSFRAEDEWRIVVMIPRDEAGTTIRVRSSGDRLIPFVELPVIEDGKLPVKRIGVGPGFLGSEDVQAVRRLCALNDYDPDVYPANTPYRRV